LGTAIAPLGGVAVRNTRNLLTEASKFCMLIYAPAKRGKTTFAATMDGFTKAHGGKPTLIIAMEPAEGGGTMSIQEYGVDYVTPTNIEEFNKIVAALAGDTRYGGVVVDSATEYVTRFLKPYALKFPYTKGTPSLTRNAGVPEQGDYQTMGEQARIDFNKLINLTTHPDLNIRKHLLVTALEKEKLTRDGKELVAIQPDLPGAMSSVATAMFQTVGCIELRTVVEADPGKPGSTRRVTKRTLVTDATEANKRIVGDRTRLIPDGAPLDFRTIYEMYWLPYFEKQKL